MKFININSSINTIHQNSGKIQFYEHSGGSDGTSGLVSQVNRMEGFFICYFAKQVGYFVGLIKLAILLRKGWMTVDLDERTGHYTLQHTRACPLYRCEQYTAQAKRFPIVFAPLVMMKNKLNKSSLFYDIYIRKHVFPWLSL